MNVMGFMQKIGRSLLIPIAVLPAASLLLGIGAGIQFDSEIMKQIAKIFVACGGAIFDNLPMLFAVGIAIGFSEGAGVAALAAVIGYYILLNVLKTFDVMGPDGKPTVHLNMGVLGGILTGFISAYLYNRFKDIQLPKAVGFFGGRRFIPIVTSFSMIFVGILIGFIWLPIQNGIEALGMWVVNAGSFGMFLYGTLNRLLIPTGLHHIINTIAWFQIGDFTDAAGKVVHGDLSRFFAGDKTAGMFMSGFFPIMMFGLPAACFAIVHEAKPQNRAMVGSILLSAALASFLTGVTEPIEFAFMFVAPLLYLLHAILTGLSLAITYSLGIKLGFGFSAGLFDYIINWRLSTNPLWLIPVGLVYFAVYYFGFRLAIRTFNLKTPGREDESAADFQLTVTTPKASGLRQKAEQILPLIGGPSNILSLDACITRLRLTLKDESVVNEAELKKLGAAGIMRMGKGNVQIVFGTESELIKEEMKKMMPA